MSFKTFFGGKSNSIPEPTPGHDELVHPVPGSMVFLDFYQGAPDRILISYEAKLITAGTNRWLIEGLVRHGEGVRPTPFEIRYLKLPIIASFADEQGLRRFHSRMLDEKSANLDRVFSIAAPSSMELVQRRRHYRLKTSVETSYSLLSPRVVFRVGFPARMLDLSEGGMRLEVTKPIEPLQYLIVRVPLGEEQEVIEVPAQVLACFPSGRTYTLRLRFDNENVLTLPEAKRSLIGHYVFQQQRISITHLKRPAPNMP